MRLIAASLPLAPLPAGWMGKAHAVVQGYRAAQGDWLIFTDADTEHSPWLLSGVMALLLGNPAAFATVWGQLRPPPLASSEDGCKRSDHNLRC